MATTVDPEKYPQAAKLDGLRAEAQLLGEFFEWLMGSSTEYVLARFDFYQHLMRVHADGQEVVAKFLGINYRLYQLERDAMLAEVRQANDDRPTPTTPTHHNEKGTA
jgi:hypothetical protein